MEKPVIKILKKVKLNNSTLIQGLPGLGWVGKIATEYMIKELKAVKFAELYSPDFHPQVLMQPDGTMRLMMNEFYYYKNSKTKQDIVFLVGDCQGLSVQSYYTIMDKLVDFLKSVDCKLIITLAGYATGQLPELPKVFGAVTDKKLVKEFAKYGVLFGKAHGNIAGSAGMTPALAELRGIHGICLMGETQGNYTDPKAAGKLVEVLMKHFKIKVDMKKLDEMAKQTLEVVQQFNQMQKAKPAPVSSDEEVQHYIR